tara:strand:- start:839 stop:1540 length:702 start_codon:yes stop_codon:yes gene_type:complete
MAKTSIERKFYLKRHTIALVITLFIFIVGILIGLRVGEMRLDFTKQDIERQQTEYESLQMQLLYLTGQEQKSCDVLLNSLERNIFDLENSRAKLENYVESNDKSSFDVVKRDYMLTEIRYWLLAKEAKKVCPNDVMSILFFYERDELCDDCSAQGYILTYLKDTFGENLLVFSLDVGFGEPMVQILKENYGLEMLPAVVVEDHVFQGLVKKEELINELCLNYDSPTFELCESV